MPVYVYECADHGTFEKTLSVHVTDEVRRNQPCPDCGEIGKKIILPTGSIFNGPGFHTNDYRSRNSTLGYKK